MGEQCLPNSNFNLVKHVDGEERIDVEAWKASHKCVLNW